ncbi:MAG TPA: helix-turn-helix domain-containing protein [Solirubrobacteraceae bacterium]|nr:helix-turn-helix domain-containing protein [Solirubrobacteraceae bacterium]
MSASNGTAPGKRDVSIALTPSQITALIDSFPGPGPASSPTRLLITLRDRASSTSGDGPFYDKKLARSLIQGLMVLCAFTDCEEHSTSEIANTLGMPASTAHRYMRTLTAINLLELDPITHLYRLAPLPSERILDTPDTPRETTG